MTNKTDINPLPWPELAEFSSHLLKCPDALDLVANYMKSVLPDRKPMIDNMENLAAQVRLAHAKCRELATALIAQHAFRMIGLDDEKRKGVSLIPIDLLSRDQRKKLFPDTMKWKGKAYNRNTGEMEEVVIHWSTFKRDPWAGHYVGARTPDGQEHWFPTPIKMK